MSNKPEYKLGAVISFCGKTSTGTRVRYQDYYLPSFRGDIKKLETELDIEIDNGSLNVAEVLDIVKARAFTATRRLVLNEPENSYATYQLRRTPKWYMPTVSTIKYGTVISPSLSEYMFASRTKPGANHSHTVDLVYNTRANFDTTNMSEQYLYNWGCAIHYSGLLKVEGRSKAELEAIMGGILDKANTATIQTIIELGNQLQQPVTFKGSI